MSVVFSKLLFLIQEEMAPVASTEAKRSLVHQRWNTNNTRKFSGVGTLAAAVDITRDERWVISYFFAPIVDTIQGALDDRWAGSLQSITLPLLASFSWKIRSYPIPEWRMWNRRVMAGRSVSAKRRQKILRQIYLWKAIETFSLGDLLRTDARPFRATAKNTKNNLSSYIASLLFFGLRRSMNAALNAVLTQFLLSYK